MRLRHTSFFAWLNCSREAFLFLISSQCLFFLFLRLPFFDSKRNAWRQHTNTLNDSKRQHSDRHIDELFFFFFFFSCYNGLLMTQFAISFCLPLCFHLGGWVIESQYTPLHADVYNGIRSTQSSLFCYQIASSQIAFPNHTTLLVRKAHRQVRSSSIGTQGMEGFFFFPSLFRKIWVL